MFRRLMASATAALGLLVFAGTAGAAQLGVTAPPTGSTAQNCFGSALYQYTDDPSTPYLVPAGGGTITQWQTYTAGDTAGSSITFAVLRMTAGGTFTVVGADTETLPNPLPSGNVASFTLAHPIQAEAGDTLALYTGTNDVCYYYGGATPTGDSINTATGTLPPTTGGTLTPGSSSPPAFTLDLAATITQVEDASVQTSVLPSTTDVSSAAILRSVVTNNGPNRGATTFTDQVPSGLTIQSASAGSDQCSTSGQTVTCAIPAMDVGHSTTVDVVVATPASGTYANDVSVGVASGVTDPNSANNTASASLVVTELPQKCIVPQLRGAPVGVARTVLTELGCTVHVVTQHAKRAKGLVLNVRGALKTYPYQQVITVVVSSGPRKKHRKHRKH
jgi:uncharacterized repeat protein (TIGR01451 family)